MINTFSSDQDALLGPRSATCANAICWHEHQIQSTFSCGLYVVRCLSCKIEVLIIDDGMPILLRKSDGSSVFN